MEVYIDNRQPIQIDDKIEEIIKRVVKESSWWKAWGWIMRFPFPWWIMRKSNSLIGSTGSR